MKTIACTLPRACPHSSPKAITRTGDLSEDYAAYSDHSREADYTASDTRGGKQPITQKTLYSQPQVHVTLSLHFRGFYLTNTTSFLHCPQPALQLASPSNINNNISNPILFPLFS